MRYIDLMWLLCLCCSLGEIKQPIEETVSKVHIINVGLLFATAHRHGLSPPSR